MRLLRLIGLLPIVAILAACGNGVTNQAATDPCFNVYYHSFYDNNAGGINNRTEFVTSQLKETAPPGCSFQSATVHSPGIGVEAVKTLAPALALAGGEIGAAAVLRPPQYNSNTSVTGAQFGAGAVAGGVANATQNQTAAGGAGGRGGAATATGGAGGNALARGGSTTFQPGAVQGGTASANNGGVRVNNVNASVNDNSNVAKASSYANAQQQQGQEMKQHQAQGQGMTNYGSGGNGGWNGNQWDPSGSSQNNNWNGSFIPLN